MKPWTDADLERLLTNPEHQDNPLLPALEWLQQREQAQRKQLEKLLRIADCSDGIARSQTHELLEQYDKQLRRLEKITRISDRYQHSLMELNEQLKQAAQQDPLTKLANRRLLMARLGEEVERCRRGASPFTLVMLDADHFKRINDDFGHEMGDRALCMMAETIVQQLRGYDLCARWGGEEFLLLLPQTELEQACHIVERVMAAVRGVRLEKEEQLRLSISAGLAMYQPDENVDLTINRADAALIQAKKNGRDQLQIART
ncbi:GGDEF domain-containing protein [Oceanisphaera marina]|uniref:diguanylate cyclase n=1 Tax=Oceanisphaera marina TaxID=2017550 RepID=A0ABQ1IDA1_9GAMM|nr:biofilm regulation diguanylate cyclase SiaD [Oceanisphaera marina]GGB33991.1 GGDEF domain-containing protein [Oceanisphaera marina]